MLTKPDSGVLKSTVSFGLPNEFDEDFNRLHINNVAFPSPLDTAFSKEEALAIVDLKKEASIPAWFMGLMNKYGISSLVAVPLVGKNSSIGVLCAYYEDVCLFDKGTLNHLMMMGRMVGGASEKNTQATSADNFHERERWLDQFLTVLTMQKLGRLDIYNLSVKIVQQALQVNGVVAGPVTMGASKSIMAIAAGKGVNESLFSKDVQLSGYIVNELRQTEWIPDPIEEKSPDLGGLKDVIPSPGVTLIARPLLWNGDIRGAVIAWRLGGPAFDRNDFDLFHRLVGIISLALHAF